MYRRNFFYVAAASIAGLCGIKLPEAEDPDIAYFRSKLFKPMNFPREFFDSPKGKLIYDPCLPVNVSDQYGVICRRTIHAHCINIDLAKKAWLRPNGDLEVESYAMHQVPPEISDHNRLIAEGKTPVDVLETKIVPAKEWVITQYNYAGERILAIIS